jgi:hypothetical protein
MSKKTEIHFCKILLAVVVGSIAIRADGQTLPNSSPTLLPQEVETQLLSEEPSQRAWGARNAISIKNPALNATLLRVAAECGPISSGQVDKRDAMAAVLDALIQLNVTVPEKTLGNLVFDFPINVAILLSRLPPEESKALNLKLFRNPPVQDLQAVSAALLARNPPSGFAAELLRDIRIEADVLVLSPGTNGGSGSHSSGDCGPDFPEKPRTGWPEFGIYYLSETDAGIPVVSTSYTIYARRLITTHYTAHPGCKGIGLSPEGRRRLIAYMLNLDPETMKFQLKASKTITFQSNAQFQSELNSYIAELRGQSRAIAIALAAKGLMTKAEEDEAIPELQLRLIDIRGDSAQALIEPKLPPRVILKERTF